jgi:hypothetical protein
MEYPNRFRPGEVRHMVADVSRLTRLGFCAETPLEDGLRQYVEWVSAQGPLQEYFSYAERQLQVAGVVRSAGPP